MFAIADFARRLRRSQPSRKCRPGKRTAWLCTVSSACLVLSYTPSLRAQTIDYGSLEQLFGEPVTTSATGSPQRAADAPASMEIIEAEEIRRSGAHDIPSVLRHVAGVDVMRWNNNSADVGLRGYNQSFSPRVLVLIDGRQVYADHYGYVPWASLPVELSAIRQIEVIKGPGAALYGFNAVSGVINIITSSPIYDDINTASIRGGTQGMGEISAVKTIKIGEMSGIRLSGSGRIDDDFSTEIPFTVSEGALREPNDRFALNINGIFTLGDGVQLGVDASHSAATTNDIAVTYTLAPERHELSSVKGVLIAETRFGLIQASLYRNWTTQKAVSPGSSNVSNNEVTVAQIQDLFRIGSDHTLRVALEYRYNKVNTTPFEGGELYFSDYAASLMWNWNILPTLSFTNAFRWENLRLGRSGLVPDDYPLTNADWNRTIAKISYNSGLVWKVSDTDTLRLLAGQGNQLPSLNALGAFTLVSPFALLTGDPNLPAVEVSNYEIDWDRALRSIDGQFRAAAFYQESKHVVVLSGGTIPGSGGGPSYETLADGGSSSARGVELSLSGFFRENWRWGVNYRFEEIEDSFLPFAVDGSAFVDFEHVTPRHVVKANIGWSRGPWEIDSYFYYQSDTRGITPLPFNAGAFLSPVPAYLSVDARIAYRFSDWGTIAISGQDLAVSPQKQTASPKVERRVFATFTVDY